MQYLFNVSSSSKDTLDTQSTLGYTDANNIQKDKQVKSSCLSMKDWYVCGKLGLSRTNVSGWQMCLFTVD